MTQPLDIFSQGSVEAFDRGEAAQLVVRRNRNLGSLLNSERAVYYVQLLYRVLLYRREHELEPLHEDIFSAVKSAQERVAADSYGPDVFNHDMRQLTEWGLLGERLEKERIRGYKDTRKTKFRYTLTGETIAFLEWLEARLQEDLEPRVSDTRDLLEEVCGVVKELGRLIRASKNGVPQEPAARRILYQIYKANELTLEISSNLGEFNARLLAFLLQDYELAALRELLEALHGYVDKYLGQIGGLRDTLLPQLKKLRTTRYSRCLQNAYEVMDKERRSAPALLRTAGGHNQHPVSIPDALWRFYGDGASLDALCHRINNSALKVWRRMSSHLKEMERKSHRLEDLRDRILEFSKLGTYQVPGVFLNRLLSWGHYRADMHYWDQGELADPPRPRRASWHRRRSPSLYLSTKSKGKGAGVSMEQARMERLGQWFTDKLIAAHGGIYPVPVSKGKYDSEGDFGKILELSRAGILGKGKKLNSLGYMLDLKTMGAAVEIGKAKLSFKEMDLNRVTKTEDNGRV